MIVRLGVMGLAAAFLVLGACSNSDEVIAEKEKALTERSAEVDTLKKRLADAEGTNLVAKKQIELKQAEVERMKTDLDRKPMEPTPAGVSETGGRELGEAAGEPVVRVSDPEIEVETLANGAVVLRLTSKELFTSGSADLTAQGQKLLLKVSDTLKKYPDYRVSVEGHTDDTPLKKTAARWKNNLNLSIARAISVRNYLSGKGRIPEGRMSVVGHGETKPLVAAKTEDARARNRRVELVLSR